MKATRDTPPSTSGVTTPQLAAIIEASSKLVTTGTKGDKIEIVLGGRGQLYINKFARQRGTE